MIANKLVVKMKSKILSVLTLLFFPFLIGLIYNSISPFGLKLFDSDNFIENKESTLKEINSYEAFRLKEKDDVIFIDSRDPWEYSKMRVASSINIPEFSFDANSPIIKSLNKDYLYVVYCSSDDCDISFRLARNLRRIKFTNLRIMKDGIEGWRKNNFPLEGSEI